MTVSTIHENAGVLTFAGSPKELGETLRHSHAEQAVAVTFKDIQQGDLEAVSQNLSTVMDLMLELLQSHQDPENLRKLVQSMMPFEVPTPRQFMDAKRLAKAKLELLNSGDWLSAANVAELAGLSTRNPGAQPNKWKKKEQIFAISHGGSDFFPFYGLDPDKNYRPLKQLADVIKVFNGHKDAWGMAFWFFSDNSFLGGQRPQDLLSKEPEQVLQAARDEVEGIQHG